MEKEVKEFSLGTATLYAAEGVVPERELESTDHCIGEARDGCRLSYECKTRELYDLEGNVAATLRFDERARLAGKLTRVFADAMPVLFPGMVKNGSRSTASMLVVCPIPGGDALRVYLRGGVSLGNAFDFKEGGRAEFELVFGKDAGRPRLVLRGGGEYA